MTAIECWLFIVHMRAGWVDGVWSLGANIFTLIQDAAAGDSGAPLFTIGKVSQDGEKTGETLIGIHSGGDNPFGANALKKQVFLPKWYARVRNAF